MKCQLTFRFNQRTESVEKPPMAVEFLLVLFFKTKDDLNGTGVHGGLSSWGTENTGGVLEYVRGDGLAVHGVFGDTLLVTAHLRRASDTDMAVRAFLDAPGSGLGESAC
jgi:hypothetical protein